MQLFSQANIYDGPLISFLSHQRVFFLMALTSCKGERADDALGSAAE